MKNKNNRQQPKEGDDDTLLVSARAVSRSSQNNNNEDNASSTVLPVAMVLPLQSNSAPRRHYFSYCEITATSDIPSDLTYKEQGNTLSQIRCSQQQQEQFVQPFDLHHKENLSVMVVSKPGGVPILPRIIQQQQQAMQELLQASWRSQTMIIISTIHKVVCHLTKETTDKGLDERKLHWLSQLSL